VAEDILAQSLVSVIDTRDEKLSFEIGARSTVRAIPVSGQRWDDHRVGAHQECGHSGVRMIVGSWSWLWLWTVLTPGLLHGGLQRMGRLCL